MDKSPLIIIPARSVGFLAFPFLLTINLISSPVFKSEILPLSSPARRPDGWTPQNAEFSQLIAVQFRLSGL